SGRFPGGQTSLFQGLWTDPVTGVAHARARWYDARNASWLSEDPYADLDSPNLYAFVAWQPNMATDPSGELLETVWDVANIMMGLHSLKHNWEERNWGGMALDAFGIVVDSAATLMPFVPGGAGAAIKGARALSKMDRIIDGLQTVDSLINIGQGVYQAREEANQGNY
ncbi:MAG: hypothetical protein GY842_27440, partial [bacterium]|nr:hypothetical protein [bacterium]